MMHLTLMSGMWPTDLPKSVSHSDAQDSNYTSNDGNRPGVACQTTASVLLMVMLTEITAESDVLVTCYSITKTCCLCVTA